VALPAFAAARHAVQQVINIPWQQQTRSSGRMDERTDGRTPDSCIDPAHAGIVNTVIARLRNVKLVTS